jgi:hypothetical protein
MARLAMPDLPIIPLHHQVNVGRFAPA